MKRKHCLRSGISNKITTLEDLQELMLLEDFKNSLPESIVVHLNQQKVSKLCDAAILPDEFVLMHKNRIFPYAHSKSSIHRGCVER